MMRTAWWDDDPDDPLGVVATVQENGETTEEWQGRHETQVYAACGGGQTIKTTWTSTSGPHEVVTERKDGESVTDWVERHFVEVMYQQALYPPV